MQLVRGNRRPSNGVSSLLLTVIEHHAYSTSETPTPLKDFSPAAKMLYTQRVLSPCPFYHRNPVLLNCGLSASIIRMFVQVAFEFEQFVFVTSVNSIGRALDFVATDLSVLFALFASNVTLSQLSDLPSYSVL